MASPSNTESPSPGLDPGLDPVMVLGGCPHIVDQIFDYVQSDQAAEMDKLLNEEEANPDNSEPFGPVCNADSDECFNCFKCTSKDRVGMRVFNACNVLREVVGRRKYDKADEDGEVGIDINKFEDNAYNKWVVISKCKEVGLLHKFHVSRGWNSYLRDRVRRGKEPQVQTLYDVAKKPRMWRPHKPKSKCNSYDLKFTKEHMYMIDQVFHEDEHWCKTCNNADDLRGSWAKGEHTEMTMFRVFGMRRWVPRNFVMDRIKELKEFMKEDI